MPRFTLLDFRVLLAIKFSTIRTYVLFYDKCYFIDVTFLSIRVSNSEIRHRRKQPILWFRSIFAFDFAFLSISKQLIISSMQNFKFIYESNQRKSMKESFLILKLKSMQILPKKSN